MYCEDVAVQENTGPHTFPSGEADCPIHMPSSGDQKS
jgi:hypothetical protein